MGSVNNQSLFVAHNSLVSLSTISIRAVFFQYVKYTDMWSCYWCTICYFMFNSSELVNKCHLVGNIFGRLSCFPATDWNLAAVSLKQSGQPYNHTGALNVPRIVSKRRLRVVLVFTGNTRLLPPVCPCCLYSYSIMPPLSERYHTLWWCGMWSASLDYGSHTRYVKRCVLALKPSNPEECANSAQPSVSQVAPPPPYPSVHTVDQVYVRQRCGPDWALGWEDVWLAHVCRRGMYPHSHSAREVAPKEQPAGSRSKDGSDIAAAEPLFCMLEQSSPLLWKHRLAVSFHFITLSCALIFKFFLPSFQNKLLPVPQRMWWQMIHQWFFELLLSS